MTRSRFLTREFVNFPGGGVEIGESPSAALRREFAEETGLSIRPVRVLYSSEGLHLSTQKPIQIVSAYWLVESAGGTLKLLDPRECAKRPLRVVLYDLVGAEKHGHTSHLESLAWLRRLGLPVNRAEPALGVDQAQAAWRALADGRATLPLDADGAVVKVDAYAQRRALGATAKHPRWAIAYKFAAQQATSRVRAIEANVGKSGKITPCVVVDPVELSGTTVQRASLHNWDRVRALS